MKKKIILRSIVIILIILNVFVMYLLSKPDKNRELEDIKVINLKRDNSIAIWVQDNNTEQWHEADNRDSWPSPSTHGFVGAECSDSEGAPIDWEKVLTFDLTNQTATIKTKQTAYCTLYFAKGEPALNWLKEKGGDTFAGSAHTAVVDGMYRFVGTNTQVLNNYVCFGTTIENECLKAPETYMYRIIGITSEADTTIGLYANQLKIIKATPSITSQQWGSSYSDNTPWGSSVVKTYLNDTFLSTITDSQPNGTYWESMISQHGWYIKDHTSIGTEEPKDGARLDGDENNRIGLMYASDYKNSGVQNTTNWLFIANGWTGNASISEWTMSRRGQFGSAVTAWLVERDMNGTLNDQSSVSFPNAIRPAFYLQSGVNLMGEGTKGHPYIIATMNNA